MLRSLHRIDKIRNVLARRQADLTVVLENVHDSHNVSAVFRSCDAVGVLRVELLYTREKFPRIGRKSSSSASKWLDQRRHTSVNACYEKLRGEGFSIYATRLASSSVSLYDLDLTRPAAFVFGNEHRGVSDEAAVNADATLHIPMMGMIESLNISVAAAVCLYEALRQRLSRGSASWAGLTEEQISTLFHEWIKR
jgi:tRNA (guanosine-2'-O-)-methyltransferase